MAMSIITLILTFKTKAAYHSFPFFLNTRSLGNVLDHQGLDGAISHALSEGIWALPPRANSATPLLSRL